MIEVVDKGKIGCFFFCKINFDRVNIVRMMICFFYFENGFFIISDKNVEGIKLKGEIYIKFRDLIRFFVVVEFDDIV